jgi:hypothetical protein
VDSSFGDEAFSFTGRKVDKLVEQETNLMIHSGDLIIVQALSQDVTLVV